VCKFFVKKAGFFRPTGGDINFRGRDRVTCVNDDYLKNVGACYEQKSALLTHLAEMEAPGEEFPRR
jgi:hypothetical protein